MADFPTRNFTAGEVIFTESSLASVAYILKEGSIEISVNRKNKKVVLAVLKPGEIFGEMALFINDHKRTATATTLEASEVIVVYKDSFYKYLNESSVVIRTLINSLIERLYKTTTMLVETEDLSYRISQILRLLSLNEITILQYDETVKTLSRTFRIDPNVIGDKLEQLARSNLIEFTMTNTGKRGIKINRNVVYID